jgi:ribosomal protein S12 methylthiotransferase accessory factor
MQLTSIIDPFVGMLQRVDRLPPIAGEPNGLVYYAASVGNLGRVLRWTPDLMGTGVGFSQESARLASIGEAIERYSGNCPERKVIRASINDLNGRGIRYYNPLETPMFLESQYQDPRFPFQPLTSLDPIDWVVGECLVPPEDSVLLPAALVYLNYYRSLPERENTRHFPVIMSGIAAGQDRITATLSALLEVLERDATMLWWHGGLEAREIDIKSSKLHDTLLDGVADATRLRLLLLPTDHPVCVVASVLINERENVLVIGTAARPDAESAALKATAEAFQLRRVSLALQDPQSWLWASRKAGLLHYPVRSFRDDSRYRDSFANDFSDMTQLAHNSQYYLDRRTWGDALARLSGRTVKLCDTQVSDFAGSGPAGELNALTDYLSNVSMKLYLCDVTASDVARCGVHVMRALVPEAMGNNPSAIPMLGNPRLRECCSRLGHPPISLPLPHS